MLHSANQLILLTQFAAHDPEDHVRPHALKYLFTWGESVGEIPGLGWAISLFMGEPPYDHYFTNHLLMAIVAGIVTLLIFVPIGRRYAAINAGSGPDHYVPRGFTGLIEAFMDALRSGVVKPVLGDDTDRFMPFLWTIFFYILINNILGMIPIDPILSFAGIKHVGGTATGNLGVTAGLALCAFGMMHYSGIKQVFHHLVAGTYGHHHDDEHDDGHAHDDHAHGEGMAAGPAFVAAPFLYVWNFAPHVFAPGPDASPVAKVLMVILDVPMWAFLLVLEVIGAIVKPFALCMRLFANMLAGHTVLANLLILLPAFKAFTAAYLGQSLTVVLGCTALSCLELFVAFLQAYIFMFLTTMFINMSVNPEH